MLRSNRVVDAVFIFLVVGVAFGQQEPYYGKLLGRFENTLHEVQGTVYIASNDTIFIQGFSYDGKGPDAHFWAGDTENPTAGGTLVPDENGSDDVLKYYRDQDLIIRLPSGKTLEDFKYFGVWCRKAQADFGHLKISSNFEVPRPQTIEGLPTLAHGVKSGPIRITDAKTLVIPDFYYDGLAPDAFFLVGKGSTITHQGALKMVKADGTQERIMRGYRGETITVSFPDDTTVRDFDWVTMYCIRFTEDFGHVFFPNQLNVPPVLPKSSSLQGGNRGSTPNVMVGSKYFGQMLGQFRNTNHEVRGTVYAMDERTFYIHDFSYDGRGPDAYFWAGTTPTPTQDGFIIPNEMGSTSILKAYRNKNLVLTLSGGKRIADLKYFGVWCRQAVASFGHVTIPDHFEPPRERRIGQMSALAHGVRSGTVTIKDVKTINIQGLHYDGKGPDAFFLVGKGTRPTGQGIKVPDENGSLKKLHSYSGQSVTLRLPRDLTFLDVDWLSMYCIQADENFGHVSIPKENLDVPADVQMLKSGDTVQFDNCEEFFDGKMQVLWKVQNDDIIFQLQGEAKENEWLAFGLSGNPNSAMMVGADVTLVFYDKDTQMGKAVDYMLTSQAQCSGDNGACPDESLPGGRDSVELLTWQRVNGRLSVTYKRSLRADDNRDISIQPYDFQTVIAAIGPLNSHKEAAYHTTYYTKDTIKLKFGRSPAASKCREPLISGVSPATPPRVKGWGPFRITNEDTFRAQIGPTGEDRGYTHITGVTAWGYSWWINGLLIPELVLVRGRNYTFIVEGGSDPAVRASYHPLYITNHPEGGGGQRQQELESADHRIYAGLKKDRNGNWIPIGAGRLCEWRSKTGVDMVKNVSTFEDYKRTLKVMCEEGSAAEFVFRPDKNTPDTLYYQCYTHRNFGWKITVTDAGSSNICKGSVGFCLLLIAASKAIFRLL